MSMQRGRSLIAMILAVSVIAPSLLFAFPKTSHAVGIGVPAMDFITEIKSTISAVATYAGYVNTYVLQPLAFVMSVGLLKALTASVISFVIGKSNGTGQPQFVQNIQANLQRVGDIQANAFFLQFGRLSNSPFAASISSSLRTKYLQQTSLAGFWSANKCTLGTASPNINAFLAGNWAQGGGTKAWFALTTQPQNNPFTLYQNSNSQLSSVIADAKNTRDKVLSWSQGFMSWCGDDSSSSGSASSGGAGGAAGANPGDPCQKSDGTPGVIKTPGSTIKSTLDKVLGSTQDKLVTIGTMAKEVQGVLQNVATIMNTINLAQSILGGSGSGGLAGFGSTGGGGSSSGLAQFSRSAFLGVTADTVYQGSATEVLGDAGGKATTRVNDYATAWSTVKTSAQNASSALTDLATSCASSGMDYSGQIASVQSTIINPAIAKAIDAESVVATARAFIAKVTDEKNLTTLEGKAAYTADLQKLQDMEPTDQTVLDAQGEATAYGRASGSGLNVSGGSLVDQMNALISNATTLKNQCLNGGGFFGGGGNGS